eukprot:TRINITY_DN29831_c0_g1_i1.p1 TRINITY_DN29831_c0_g1~~TRINITY_DN29831_c0_g1_i1.p1  ORF type:complete len:553 (+),score=228.61 TRINITY_DN29831_c0_g1_i1:67-1725(+)
MDTGSFKAALAGYKRKLAELTPDAAGRGLTAETKQALNAALGAIRKEAALLDAQMSGLQEAAGTAAEKKGEVEEDKLLGVLGALEEEEGQLVRCYAIPKVLTGVEVPYGAAAETEEPPRKRLLRSLRDGVARKYELKQELDAVNAARVDHVPLVSVETRNRVRELNQVSTGLMELDGMRFKPNRAQFEQGKALDALPAELRLCWMNLKALSLAVDVAISKDSPPAAITDLTFDADVQQVAFSVAGVRFTLQAAPEVGAEAEGDVAMDDASASPSPRNARAAPRALAVKSDFDVSAGGTAAFAHLLPGVQVARGDGEGDDGWHRFAWLHAFAAPPTWTHTDCADMGADVHPGQPAVRCGQLRAFTSIDAVVTLLAERAGLVRALAAHGDAEVVAQATVEGCRVFLATSKALAPKRVLAVYPLDAPYRPVHVRVVDKEFCDLSTVRFAAAPFDPLFCAPETEALGKAAGGEELAAVSATLTYDLGVDAGKAYATAAPPPPLADIVAKAAAAMARAKSAPKRTDGKIVTTCWTPYGTLLRKWNEKLCGWTLAYKE